MAGQALGDLLAGAAGHPINRPALDSAVMQGQALAGLRTSQTEEALANADEKRQQFAARERLENALAAEQDVSGNPVRTPSQAKVAATSMIAGFGNAEIAEKAHQEALKSRAFSTVADPNADPNARLAADQALNPTTNPYQVAGNQLIPRMAPNSQTAPAAVQQTPVSEADVANKQGSANLHNTQASVGGFNPNTGKSPLDKLQPDSRAALEQAMQEGRLSPKDLNSRNVDIYAHMALTRPGYNFNRAIADASLSRNPTFQQRAQVAEALPGLLQNVVSLGSKLNYPDLKIAGLAQQFMQGQTNDPMLAEYMAARNDALFKIAGVMRGVGMSDKSFQAEDEIAHPTMSAAALNGWLKGQMSAINKLLEQQRRASHIGEPGANGEGGGPAANDPLGIR